MVSNFCCDFYKNNTLNKKGIAQIYIILAVLISFSPITLILAVQNNQTVHTSHYSLSYYFLLSKRPSNLSNEGR